MYNPPIRIACSLRLDSSGIALIILMPRAIFSCRKCQIRERQATVCSDLNSCVVIVMEASKILPYVHRLKMTKHKAMGTCSQKSFNRCAPLSFILFYQQTPASQQARSDEDMVLFDEWTTWADDAAINIIRTMFISCMMFFGDCKFKRVKQYRTWTRTWRIVVPVGEWRTWSNILQVHSKQ